MKKLFALFMTVALIMSCVPAWAETGEYEFTQEEEVRLEQPAGEEPQAEEPQAEEPAAEEPQAEEPPGEEKTPEPFSASVTVVQVTAGTVYEGDTVEMKAKVSDANRDYTILWQRLDPREDNPEWTEIGSGEKLTLIAGAETSAMTYRVVLVADSQETVVSRQFIILQPQPRPAEEPEEEKAPIGTDISESVDMNGSQEPAPVQEPAGEPMNAPAPGDEPVNEPQAEPAQEPAQEPQAEPVQEPVQEPQAEPVQEPAQEPQAEPAQEPVEDPEKEPVDVLAPAREPENEPAREPAGEPANAPAPEKEPERKAEGTPEAYELPADRKVAVELTWDTDHPTLGSIAHFRAVLSGYDTLNYTLQWQRSADNAVWEDIPDAREETLDVMIHSGNYQDRWRVVVYIHLPEAGK